MPRRSERKLAHAERISPPNVPNKCVSKSAVHHSFPERASGSGALSPADCGSGQGRAIPVPVDSARRGARSGNSAASKQSKKGGLTRGDESCGRGAYFGGNSAPESRVPCAERVSFRVAQQADGHRLRTIAPSRRLRRRWTGSAGSTRMARPRRLVVDCRWIRPCAQNALARSTPARGRPQKINRNRRRRNRASTREASLPRRIRT